MKKSRLNDKTIAWLLTATGTLVLGLGLLLLTIPGAGLLVAHAWAAVRHTPVRQEWAHTITRTSIDMLLLAAVVITTGAALSNHGLVLRWSQRARFRVATASLLALSTQLCVIWFRNSFLYGNTRIWFLDDDAMISMRYGLNLASGRGLVWNIGQRVEGYTNFLWTCFMAGIHLMGVRTDHAAFFVLISNIAICIGLIAALDRLMTRFGVSGPIVFAALLLCALSRDIVLWSASGLETVALAFLVTLAVPGVATERPRRTDTILTCVALALLPLTRSDAVVLDLLLLSAALVQRARPHSLWLYVACALMPATAHLLFRYYYYDAWLPNTAYLKVTGSSHLVGRGVSYLCRFLASHLVVSLAAIGSFWHLQPRLRGGLALLLSGYLSYVTYVGGDAFEGFRFLVPVLPLLFALAGTSIQRYFHENWARTMACAVLIATAPLLLPNRWLSAAPAFATSLSPSYGDVGNVQIGMWLRDYTPADALVADYWAGSVFYFSGRRGVDLLGKTDSTIARMPPRCDKGAPGHTKYDFGYSLGVLRPDYVVAGFRIDNSGKLWGPSGESIARDGSFDPCEIFAALAHDEIFTRLYLPHVATNQFWRTVFAASSANGATRIKRVE